ncbi:MAG: hypothetical protein H7331_11610 [Bacteroidia bacterium]|nr:hypothetical protein [Bacteroidia bacterium]
MENILFNTPGLILSGSDSGKYIVLEDDSFGDTGGYYTYITNSLNSNSQMFDNWYEDLASIERFMNVTKVKWL